MAGTTASRLMGRLRGKGEASGSGTPKKRGSKPNGPAWQEQQLVGPWEE